MVVEQGSFTRAAAHLGVTTSTLSATIRRLEERIGVRLLHRTTRSVAPSEAGQRARGPPAPQCVAHRRDSLSGAAAGRIYATLSQH